MTGRWIVEGRTLTLESPSGLLRVPSTDEIYTSLVERKPVEDWIPAAPKGLRASRYPLIPALAIKKSDDSDTPFYRITGSCLGIVHNLELVDLERGHTVVDDIWYPLHPEIAEEVQEVLASTGAIPGPATSLKTFLAVRRAAAGGAAVEDEIANQIISPRVFIPKGNDTPKGVNANLYQYQFLGWRWLRFLLAENIGGLLADEMGLGKTLQIISVLSDCGEISLSPALVVAPGSLLENWRREIARFAPRLTVLKHHGPHRTGRPAILNSYDVVITSYDSVVRDNSLLNMIHWEVVILDEAQYIRNPTAQRTKAVKHLQRRTGLAVTGTPVENRLLDLWSIMDFVLPGHLGDQRGFEAQYNNDMHGASLLEPRVSPLMLRRRVSEVAQDLPPRIDIPQILELDEDEAEKYEAARIRIKTEHGAAAALVALTSLRRFCAHPALMSDADLSTDPMSFSKFRRLDEIVEEIFAKGEKVIIFTSFTTMADMITRHIKSRYAVFAGIIDGRLAIDKRQPLIDLFCKTEGGSALVLNPKAGGTGLNITAANHVIHYNPEWNPALEDQASARAYRRGQKLPVTVHRLLVADTVEEVVDDRLRRKRNLSSTAVIGLAGEKDDYPDIVAALTRSPVSATGM